jgi:hypothetical protein
MKIPTVRSLLAMLSPEEIADILRYSGFMLEELEDDFEGLLKRAGRVLSRQDSLKVILEGLEAGDLYVLDWMTRKGGKAELWEIPVPWQPDQGFSEIPLIKRLMQRGILYQQGKTIFLPREIMTFHPFWISRRKIITLAETQPPLTPALAPERILFRHQNIIREIIALAIQSYQQCRKLTADNTGLSKKSSRTIRKLLDISDGNGRQWSVAHFSVLTYIWNKLLNSPAADSEASDCETADNKTEIRFSDTETQIRELMENGWDHLENRIKSILSLRAVSSSRWYGDLTDFHEAIKKVMNYIHKHSQESWIHISTLAEALSPDFTEKAEDRILEITDYLHRMGLLNLGCDSHGNLISVMNSESNQDITIKTGSHDSSNLHFNERGHMILSGLISPLTLLDISAFSDLICLAPCFVMKISANSIQRGTHSGLTVQSMVETLKRLSSNPVPGALMALMRSAESKSERMSLVRGEFLIADDPDLFTDINFITAIRNCTAATGNPSVIRVRAGQKMELLKRLRKAGHNPRIHNESNSPLTFLSPQGAIELLGSMMMTEKMMTRAGVKTPVLKSVIRESMENMNASIISKAEKRAEEMADITAMGFFHEGINRGTSDKNRKKSNSKAVRFKKSDTAIKLEAMNQKNLESLQKAMLRELPLRITFFGPEGEETITREIHAPYEIKRLNDSHYLSAFAGFFNEKITIRIDRISGIERLGW